MENEELAYWHNLEKFNPMRCAALTIMSSLQDFAQLPRGLESTTVHFFVAGSDDFKNLPIEFRICASEWCDGTDIIMDPRVNKNTPSRLALVELVDPQVLDVDTADLDVEVLTEDREFDTTTPAILALNPATVGRRLLL
jgi:hypothetical protein